MNGVLRSAHSVSAMRSATRAVVRSCQHCVPPATSVRPVSARFEHAQKLPQRQRSPHGSHYVFTGPRAQCSFGAGFQSSTWPITYSGDSSSATSRSHA